MKARVISMCPLEPSHQDFLINLFTECHSELFLITNISEEQKKKIIYEQFVMEQQQLLQIYPEAELNIVRFNNEFVGRLYINYGVTEDRILEIGLLRNFRGLGIGREIVNEVIEKALIKGKTVSLQVAWFNEKAYAFYKKLGFKVIQEKGAFYEMKYIS